MTTARTLCWLTAAALLGGCGGSRSRPPTAAKPSAPRSPVTLAPAPGARPPARGHPGRARRSRPQALVTAETENRLLIVDLETGAVNGRVTVPAGPQYVAAQPGLALVASPSAGAVALLEGDPLRVVRVFSRFGAPHITELSPDGEHAYVTDDARGTLTVIQLSNERVIGTVQIGTGAHHMASSPDQRRLWVALGESARTIAIVDTSDPSRPRVVGRLHLGFAAHDLAFSPDGQRVWISSAGRGDVSVFRASDRRLLLHVPVGPAPQHIGFAGAYAYLTSGYGRTIEQVAAGTGTVIRRASAPYGSFELAAADGFVTTSSLLDGRLAIYTPQLRLLRLLRLSAATRDVSISDP
ncbi:MAG: YncE family protein [Actinomycetota bacterium]|nr:YncE family protein [Actinomycetota bacterium]